MLTVNVHTIPANNYLFGVKGVGFFNTKTTGFLKRTWVNLKKFYTCNVQVGPLYLQGQTKTSLISIVTSPSYKCPTCNYRCIAATHVKYGK